MSDDSMIEAFVDEAREHLETIEDDILTLEKQGDTPDTTLVDSVFRAMHTIKGNAGFFGLNTIRDLAHALEDLLSCIRNGEMVMTRANADAVLEGVDLLNRFLENPESSNGVDTSEIVGRLRGLIAHDVGDEKGEELRKVHTLQDEGGEDLNLDLTGLDLGKVRPAQHLVLVEFNLAEWEKNNKLNLMKLVKNFQKNGNILDVQVQHEMIDMQKEAQTAMIICKVILATELNNEKLVDILKLPKDSCKGIQSIDSSHLDEEGESNIPHSAPKDVITLAENLTMGDLAPLVSIMDTLKKEMETEEHAGAWKTTAVRLLKLAEQLLMGEVHFENGSGKLREGLRKLFPAGTKTTAPPTEDDFAGLDEEPEEIASAASSSSSMEVNPLMAPHLQEFVSSLLSSLDELEVMILESEKGIAEAQGSIKAYLHTLKGELGVLELDAHAELVHAIESALQSDMMTSEQLLQYKDYLATVMQSYDGKSIQLPDQSVLDQLLAPEFHFSIAAANDAKEDPKATKPAEVDTPKPQQESTLETAPSLDAPKAPINGQKPTASQTTEKTSAINGEKPEAPAPLKKKADDEIPGSAEAVPGVKKPRQDDSLRVSVGRLDKLIDTIGEAVIAHSIATGDPVVNDTKNPVTASERNLLKQKLNRLDMIMRQIQEFSMSLRMISLKGTFQKMSRLVRDLSRDLQKPVDFVMEGEDTELDKSIVENLGDPLIHMVRNSMDHGIEDQETRKKAGKKPTGTVTLKAYHKAGNVVIEVRDDGKGLDNAQLLAKAIKKGIVKEDDQLTDDEIQQLIFHPGFSTKEAVSQLSGRGVGMDVVKRNIEAMRGAVEISSEYGKGSVFTIKLPLTLAIISGMIISSNKEKYIIPTLAIVETLRVKHETVQSVTGKGEMIKLRNELLKVVHVDEVLETGAKNSGWEERIGLVVEDAMGRKCALLTDHILDQQQVVIKKIGEGLGEIQGVSGGAIMNDGNISLILDVNGIIKTANN